MKLEGKLQHRQILPEANLPSGPAETQQKHSQERRDWQPISSYPSPLVLAFFGVVLCVCVQGAFMSQQAELTHTWCATTMQDWFLERQHLYIHILLFFILVF